MSVGRDPRLKSPWFSQGFGSEAIGLFVVDERVCRVVKLHLSIQVKRDVRCVAGDVRVAGGLSIPLG